MKSIINYRTFIFSLFILTNAVFAQWEKVAMPGSRGGAVYSICFKDSLMFAGIKGGVYVSADDGEHWKKVNPDLPPRENSALVFSLASSGEKLIAAFNEPGVYISSDDGNNWFKANINECLRCTPYEITANEDFIIGGNISGKTYKSYDNGLTWELDTLSWATSFAIKDSLVLAQSLYPGKEGIYRSTNYGSKWTKVYSTPFMSSSNSWRTAIAFSDSLVFAGVNGYMANGYIIKSSDNGLTWNNSSYLNCTSIYSIIEIPGDTLNNFIYAGTDSGLYRSTDHGEHWFPQNNGINSSHILSLTFNNTGNILYAGTGDGIFCSSDYGESWNAVGSPSEWIFSSNGSDIFAASSNERYGIQYDRYQTTIYHSSDNGVNWDKKFSGYLHNDSKINTIEIMNNNGNIDLYAVIEGFNNNINPSLYSTIIFSDNLGTSWKKVYPDTANRFTVIKINALTIFVCELLRYNHPGHSYSAGSIFRSIDFGNSWLRVVDSTADVSAFTFYENKIYAAGSKIDASFIPPRSFETKLFNSIIVSTDNGLTWNKVKSPLDSAKVINDELTDTLSVISSSFAKDSDLLVGMRAFNFHESPISTPFANGGGLYHLWQNGEKWDIADSSFMGRSIFAFESNEKNIFMATDTGVFRSTDYGSTWDDISSGMKNIFVSSIFKSDNYLYANTINGIWKRPLSEITAIDDEKNGGKIPNKFSLSQNYPNPFNPVTYINYSIPYSSDVSLKVYNLLGEEVATLFEGYRQAGNYEVVFDGSGFPSGVYFYRMKANNFGQFKKLILLK